MMPSLAHPRPPMGTLVAARDQSYPLCPLADAAACPRQGLFVAARHACTCPWLGPLTVGIWGLCTTSAEPLPCNALGFAVMAPSATPASSRPGQQLPQQGNAGRLWLTVLP